MIHQTENVTLRNYFSNKVNAKNKMDKSNDEKYFNKENQLDDDVNRGILSSQMKKKVSGTSKMLDIREEEQTEINSENECQKQSLTSPKKLGLQHEFDNFNQKIITESNESSLQSNQADDSFCLNDTKDYVNESFVNAINKTIIKYNASWDAQFLQMKSEKSMMLLDKNEQTCPLTKWRSRLANLQLTQGSHLPADKEYSFFLVLGLILKALGTCCLALVYLFCNLLPSIEIIVHIVKFVFDRAIDIKKSQNTTEAFSRTATFIVQLIIIHFCFILMFNFLTWPIIKLAIGIFSKLMFFK